MRPPIIRPSETAEHATRCPDCVRAGCDCGEYCHGPVDYWPAVPRTYTHPDVFALGVELGWAEPETDPACIDWPSRQAAAAIPFEVVDGRPVNPCDLTGVFAAHTDMLREFLEDPL
jgi:hypothetical protein